MPLVFVALCKSWNGESGTEQEEHGNEVGTRWEQQDRKREQGGNLAENLICTGERRIGRLRRFTEIYRATLTMTIIKKPKAHS